MALTSDLYLARLHFADSFRRRIHFLDIIFRIDPIKPAIPMILLLYLGGAEDIGPFALILSLSILG